MNTKRWFTGTELITRWDIQPFELIDYLGQGLQAYSHQGKKAL